MKRGVSTKIIVSIPGKTIGNDDNATVAFRQEKTHTGDPMNITATITKNLTDNTFEISLAASETQKFDASKPVYMDLKPEIGGSVIPTEIVTLSVYDTLFKDTP